MNELIKNTIHSIEKAMNQMHEDVLQLKQKSESFEKTHSSESASIAKSGASMLSSVQSDQEKEKATFERRLQNIEKKRAELTEQAKVIEAQRLAELNVRKKELSQLNSKISALDKRLSYFPVEMVTNLSDGIVKPKEHEVRQLEALLSKINDVSFVGNVKCFFKIGGYYKRDMMKLDYVNNVLALKAYYQDQLEVKSAALKADETRIIKEIESQKNKLFHDIKDIEEEFRKQYYDVSGDYDNKLKSIDASQKAKSQQLNRNFDATIASLEKEKKALIDKREKFFNSPLVKDFPHLIDKMCQGSGLNDSDWKSNNGVTNFKTFVAGKVRIPISCKSNSLPQMLEKAIPGYFMNGSFEIPMVFSAYESNIIYFKYLEQDKGDISSCVQLYLLQKIRCCASGTNEIYFMDPKDRGRNLGILTASDTENADIGIFVKNTPEGINEFFSKTIQKIDSMQGTLGSVESVKTYNERNEKKIPETILVFNDIEECIDHNTITNFKTIFENAKRCGITIIMTSSMDREKVNAIMASMRSDFNCLLSMDVQYVQAFSSGYSLTYNGKKCQYAPMKIRPIHSEFIKAIRNPFPTDQNSSLLVNDFRRIFTDLYTKNQRDEYIANKHAVCNWRDSDSTSALEIPFAVSLPIKMPLRATDLSFGDTAVHALITGQTGCGKSTLLHMLIMSIVTKYDPDDVEIWLVDYGINEFKTYAYNRPPHVRFLALEKSQDFSYSFLDHLDKMRKEREELFRGEVGVASLKDYRKKHGKLSLPRIVVIMDEFHVMTQHIQKQRKYALSLENALAEGRKYGFSFIFANQTMSALDGLSQAATDQLGIRIAMQNTTAEILESLDVRRSELIDNFAAKASKGDFLFRDSNREIRTAKAIFIHENTRRELLEIIDNQNIHPRIDAETFVINGEERLPISLSEISRDISLYNGRGIQIHLGIPCSIEKKCFFELLPRYDENLLLIGREPLMIDIIFVLVYSLMSQAKNRVVFVIDPDDELLPKYHEANNHLFHNRIEIIDRYESLCDFTRSMKENINDRRMEENNIFIFWIGLRAIMSEIKHYPDEQADSSNVQANNASSSGGGRFAASFDDFDDTPAQLENNDTSNLIYIDEDRIRSNPGLMEMLENMGESVEEFVQAARGFSAANDFSSQNYTTVQTTRVLANPGVGVSANVYNASMDIGSIIALGSKQRIFSIMHTDSNAAFLMHREIRVESFSHFITTECTESERERWSFPTNSPISQPGISAQYISGGKVKNFKPYKIDFDLEGK